MVGLIHKVLFELLSKVGGTDLIERITERTGVDLASVRTIDLLPDSGFPKLMDTVVAESGVSRSQLMQMYAVEFLNHTEKNFPEFFKSSESAREFLIRQPKIHATLGSGLGSTQDQKQLRQKFNVEEFDEMLVVTYESEAGLCDLYQALAHELAKRFGEKISVSVERCGGGSGCTLHLYFGEDVVHKNLSVCSWISAD